MKPFLDMDFLLNTEAAKRFITRRLRVSRSSITTAT